MLISECSMAQTSNFFKQADSFFMQYVKDGNVAYDKISGKPGQLAQLVKAIETFPLNGSDAKTKKAFMINAYNILAIKGIVDSYPVKSPFDINNFFDDKRYKVAGATMSLNQLEKEKLYPFAKDPRLHFVLVCAAKSCPKLADFAYTPDQLEKQLEKKTRETLNDTEFIQVSGKKAQVSEIFNWYARDFKKDGSVADYINKYRTTPLPSSKLGYYTYDWSLNAQ